MLVAGISEGNVQFSLFIWNNWPDTETQTRLKLENKSSQIKHNNYASPIVLLLDVIIRDMSLHTQSQVVKMHTVISWDINFAIISLLWRHTRQRVLSATLGITINQTDLPHILQAGSGHPRTVLVWPKRNKWTNKKAETLTGFFLTREWAKHVLGHLNWENLKKSCFLRFLEYTAEILNVSYIFRQVLSSRQHSSKLYHTYTKKWELEYEW